MATDTDRIFDGPGPDAQFAAFLKEGRFCLQYSPEADRYVFYPRVVCPYTGSTRLEWREVSGRGTVHATTVVRRKPERGGDYNVALIDLEEGARMMSRVEGIAPEEVKIGMKVQARIVEEEGTPLVVFRPAEGGGNG